MSVFLRSILGGLSLGVLVTLGLAVPGQAFEADSGDTVSTTETKSNFHVSANTITINENIEKDLVAAGNTILVNADIERNALLGGNQITINGDVGGSVRAAGNQLTLNGNFADDVIVAGNQITITDAVIEGDLVVGANTLNLVNSRVTGDLLAGYDNYDGDSVEEQVAGEVKTQDPELDEKIEETKERGQGAAAVGVIVGTIWREIGTIVALLVLTLFLRKRNRLAIPSLHMDQRVFWNFLLGLGFIVIGPVLGGVLVIFGGPTGIGIVLSLIGLTLLSSIFLPVYLANLLKNSLGIGLGIFALTWVVYLLLLVFGVLQFVPFLGQILSVLVFVFFLANFGYVLTTLWRALSSYVAPRKHKKK